jgi:hypothetical protein
MWDHFRYTFGLPLSAGGILVYGAAFVALMSYLAIN